MALPKDTVDVPVILHIYNVSTAEIIEKANNVFRAVGTGAFHGAVEVYGTEYSYGYTEEPGATGVFECPPKGCEVHTYRETQLLGTTRMTEAEVQKLLERLRKEWPGEDYGLLTHNCCHFCDVFAKELGVKDVPFWVTNLAGAGANVRDAAVGTATAVTTVATAVGTVASKAVELEQRMGIVSTATDAVGTVASKAVELNQQYEIVGTAHTVVTNTATTVGAAAQHVGKETATRVNQLDERFKVTENIGVGVQGLMTYATATIEEGKKAREGAGSPERGATQVGDLARGLWSSVGGFRRAPQPPSAPQLPASPSGAAQAREGAGSPERGATQVGDLARGLWSSVGGFRQPPQPPPPPQLPAAPS